MAYLTCDGSLLQSATYSGILHRSRIQPAPKYPKIREVQESRNNYKNLKVILERRGLQGLPPPPR